MIDPTAPWRLTCTSPESTKTVIVDCPDINNAFKRALHLHSEGIQIQWIASMRRVQGEGSTLQWAWKVSYDGSDWICVIRRIEHRFETLSGLFAAIVASSCPGHEFRGGRLHDLDLVVGF